MTDQRITPPREAACLSRMSPSAQRGGTLIAEFVVDLESHQHRIKDPDGYRPASCPSCGHSTLHLHDYRQRASQQVGGEVTVARYRCAACTAKWQVLPAFVPRHLSYHWPTIEKACARRQTVVPAEQGPTDRTKLRWLSRLRSSARFLVQVLATSAASSLVGIAQQAGLDSTRWQLLDVLPQSFASLAGLLHRLIPGVRLM